MKTTLFNIIFFILLSSFVKSQTPEVEWLAKNIRPDGDTYIEKLLPLDNNGYIALRGKETMTAMSSIKIFLQRYDNDFKPGIVKLIPYRIANDQSPDNGKIPTIIYTGKFSEDVYIFTCNINKENQSMSLLAKRIDPETLNIDEAGIKLFDVTLQDKIRHDSYKILHLTTSPDGNNLLVLFDNSAINDQQKKIEIYVFSNKLQLIKQKQLTLDYKTDKLYLNSCIINNSGNIAFSAKLYNDKKYDPQKRIINYEFILFYLHAADDNFTETILSVPGITLVKLEQTFDQKGNLACAGFYTSPSMSVYKGVFIMQVNPFNSNILNSSYKSFGPENVRKMISDEVKSLKLVDDHSVDDYGFIIKELIIQDNGTVKMIAEQKFDLLCYSLINNSRDNYPEKFKFQSFESILCVSADNTATIQWLTIIPKLQDEYPSDTYYYSSYKSRIYNGKIQFIYNENPEKDKTNKPQYLEWKSKFVTVIKTIDENGNVSTEELWDPTVDKVMLVPKSCYMIGDKQLIFEAKNAKKEYFGKISF